MTARRHAYEIGGAQPTLRQDEPKFSKVQPYAPVSFVNLQANGIPRQLKPGE